MIKLALASLLLASMSFAVPLSLPQSACVTAGSGGSAIPVAYSLSNAKSLILTLGLNTSATHFAVTANSLSSAVAISLSTNTAQAAPASNSANQLLIDSNLLPALDGIRVNQAILIRSNTGSTITSGTICVLVW